jgi:ABC-type spermidine/putrescine transport system permease subunit II
MSADAMPLSRGERIADVLLGVLVALALIILYAPVIIGALFSVVPIEQGAPQWQAATFAWYGALADNQSVIDAVKTTLLVGTVSVFAATFLAIAIALYVRSEQAIAASIIELVVYLPFLVPPIIIGLSMLVFFANIGIDRGLVTLIVGHTAFVTAVIYRLVSTRLAALPASLVSASADLGATSWQTFRYVLWPHLRSAALTGAILAFTLSFDETFISVFLAGDAVTLPLRLWGMARVGFTPEINALVTLVLVVSIALTFVIALRFRATISREDEQ